MRSLNPWPVFPTNLETPVARSLSIQFILQILIDGFALVENEIACTEPAEILSELEKIMLLALKHPMSQKGGILDKLSFYSDILMEASPVKGSLIYSLEEMRRSILFFKSKMMVWKKMLGSYPREEMLEQLTQLYSDLSQGFCHYFNALIPFLKEARSDENVLIYLIENKEKLDKYLGPKSIELTLQSFFPAGFDQLRAVIYEGYTRRGFGSFFSTVEPLIDEIQWETPCHVPELQ